MYNKNKIRIVKHYISKHFKPKTKFLKYIIFDIFKNFFQMIQITSVAKYFYIFNS